MPASKEERVEQFKHGIFSLRTNFGELAQLMIKEKYGFDEADDTTYDLKDSSKQGIESHIEVKFARAYRNPSSITRNNVLSLCSNSSIDVYLSTEWNDSDLFCNIQQVKPELFRTLYYGVFWKDMIEIFCIDSAHHGLFPDSLERFKSDANYRKEIRTNIPYFYLQHNQRDFQFHLKKGSIPKHRSAFAKCTMTYEDLYDLFTQEE